MFDTVKKLATNSIIYGIGDILGKAVSFFLIPLYTHYLTTEEYGVLELLDLSTYVVSFFVTLGIAQAVVRFYYKFETKEEQDRVISVALLSVWTAALLAFAILYLNAESVSSLVFETSANTTFFQIVFATMVLTLGSEIPLDYLRVKDQALRYTLISLTRVTLTLVLNILFIVHFQMKIMGILLSSLIANACVGLYLLYYLLPRIQISFSIPLLREMLAYSFPLVFTWLGGFTLHFCDRFVLQRTASLEEVGLYALAYKFGFLLNVLLLTPFNLSWGPKQFEIAEHENAGLLFSRIFTYYISIQAFLTLGISVVIEDVIKLISAEAFHSASIYVAPLLLAYNFYGAFYYFQFAALYKQKTRLLALATLSAGAVNIVANFLLVPTHGAWGATMATLISFTLLFCLTYALCQKLYYIKIEVKRIVSVLCIAFLFFLACSMIAVDSELLSIALKTALACCFPLLLWYMPFLESDEAEAARDLFRRKRLSFLQDG